MNSSVDEKECFWHRHLRFVKENDPENLPEILHAHLMAVDSPWANSFEHQWYKSKSFSEDVQIAKNFIAEHNIVF